MSNEEIIEPLLPVRYGNWNSIYHKFRKWCAQDVFENILQALVANTEKYLLVEIDSTFCKVQSVRCRGS